VSDEEQPEASTPRRRPRWRRILVWVFGGVAALLLAVRAALPYAIEYAAPIAAERFGFAAALENVDLGLLRGHVALEGVRVAPLASTSSGAEAPDLLRLGRLFVDLEWSGLLGGEIEIADLVLDRPELALVRAADGFLELPALPPSTEPKPAAAPPAEPGEPLPVTLRSLTIRDTGFRLVDATGGGDLVDLQLAELGLGELRLVGPQLGLGGIRISEPRLSVRRELRETRFGARGAPAAPAEEAAPTGPPDLRIDTVEIERAEFAVVTEEGPITLALALHTTDVSFAPAAPFPVELRIEERDSTLGVVGTLGLNPPSFDGKVTWERLDVPLLVRAAMPELIAWIRSCAASGEIDVRFGPAGLRLAGRGKVETFAFEDPEGEIALAWDSLDIEVREATVPLGEPTKAPELLVGAVSLDAPSARYVLPNTAVERLLATAGGGGADEAPAEASDAPVPEPRVRVEAIEVRGGKAEFVDRSGEEPYRGRVRDLSVDVAEVRLPERTIGKLRVRGLAPEDAPFDLEAALPGAEGNARLGLERLPLPQFTPYAVRAADLRIPSGELSLDTTAQLARAGAEGTVETQVRVHRLALDGATDTITVAGMPLDLVLALLRDPKGDIALDVPLHYGDAGAGTRLTTVLRGALVAAIKGAVTSPIKAAGIVLPEGGLPLSFGTKGGGGFRPVVFAPGSADPPTKGIKRVAQAAALLEARPTLGFTLRGSAGPKDRDALAEQILIERVGAGDGLPELADAPFFARRRVEGALAARGRGEPGTLEAEDVALLARYVAATDVPPERFAGLARERATALQRLLEEEHDVAPGRVVVEVASEPGPPSVRAALRPAEAPAPGVR
jgi:hypothetical protein